MSKKPFDLKNDPKFKAKVKKLEGNKYLQILKEPLHIKQLDDECKVYVVAIGIHDAYLLLLLSDENEIHVSWSKRDNFTIPTEQHSAVTPVILNWLMMYANESDIIKVPHGSKMPSQMAFDAMVKIKGLKYVQDLGEMVTIQVQGYIVTQLNPYRK